MAHPRIRFLLSRSLWVGIGLLIARNVVALECGDFSFPKCKGPDSQYAGKFDPGTGDGGFGGGACKATKTPIVFVHGNGDRAINWDAPVEPSRRSRYLPPRSVYDELRNRGYNECELFGVSYLDKQEQEHPQGNYHRPNKYGIIVDFIRAVKAYTGSQQVDLVAHSLGVTMTLAALKVNDAWGDVRRFINIAGGIRGLDACLSVGPANPLAPTCGSGNVIDHTIFGFYPYSNDWTGNGTQFSFREMPRRNPGVRFYTIHAGAHDQIHCGVVRGTHDCSIGPLFERSNNVMAQLDIGTGATTRLARQGGDSDGVGHFKARMNAGAIIYTMLNTDCRGLNCKGSYRGPVKSTP